MDIGRILLSVNQLSSFPLDVEQLKDWSLSVDEILPELKLEDLSELMLEFKRGRIKYDRNDGIQNIFTGLVLRFGGVYDK